MSITIFLTKTKTTDLVYQYHSDAERLDVKSQRNATTITALSANKFKSRKLKEDDAEKLTVDILSIRVDSNDYLEFISGLEKEIFSRMKNITSNRESISLGDEETNADLCSLEELIEISIFFSRYIKYSDNKKYKDYTFYLKQPVQT